MVPLMNRTTPALGTKQHYQVLDGLRGVAALMVVIFHTFEAYADSSVFRQKVNHGYMAVDFFFLLSGFVVAYAYDDRWGRMTQWDFYKRRLIRLQPMVVMGNVIGASLFYLQAAPIFPLIAHTPVWKMLLVMLVGCTMIPLTPAMDIRGWDEMHPLDGPAWSLFFEYIANILYALWLRRLGLRWLSVLTVLAGAFLVQMLVWGPRGDVIGGWSINREQLHIGFARLLFPFLAGMLLMRSGKRLQVKNAFLWCSLLLVVSFSLPRFGGPQHLWVNGLYEAFCIIVVYPLVVAMGAGSVGEAPWGSRFLGEISFPLYITHYGLIYWYTAWVTRDHVPAARGAAVGVVMFFAAVGIAYACLKWYDEPVRKWLGARFLPRGVKA